MSASLIGWIAIRDGMYTCHLERVMPERDWECESLRIDKK